MKAIIQIDDSGSVIVLPADKAALAAELLACATIFQRDSYPRHDHWICKGVLSLRFGDASEYEPPSAKEQELQQQLNSKNTDWLAQYTEAQKAKKELAEAKAALEAIKSVTVCKTVESPLFVPEEELE